MRTKHLRARTSNEKLFILASSRGTAQLTTTDFLSSLIGEKINFQMVSFPVLLSIVTNIYISTSFTEGF